MKNLYKKNKIKFIFTKFYFVKIFHHNFPDPQLSSIGQNRFEKNIEHAKICPKATMLGTNRCKNKIHFTSGTINGTKTIARSNLFENTIKHTAK